MGAAECPGRTGNSNVHSARQQVHSTAAVQPAIDWHHGAAPRSVSALPVWCAQRCLAHQNYHQAFGGLLGMSVSNSLVRKLVTPEDEPQESDEPHGFLSVL